MYMLTRSKNKLDYESSLELALAADIIFSPDVMPDTTEAIITALVLDNPTVDQMMSVALTLTHRLLSIAALGSPVTRRTSIYALVDSVFTRIWDYPDQDKTIAAALIWDIYESARLGKKGHSITLDDPLSDTATLVRFVLTLSYMITRVTNQADLGAVILKAAGY
jgi:hypothetical protein